MKTLIYYILIGILSSTVLSCNRSSDSVKRAERTNDSVFGNDINKGFLNDADFVVTAFNIGLTEIKIGNIAQKNGLDQGVKDLGKQAIADYSKMNETLKTLSTKKDITLPTEIGKKSNKEVNEISERSGNIFDRAYTDLMIKKRAREIKTFEEAEKEASDLDIKTFASETLPMLRKQLTAAEELKLRIPYY
jgi:putative membrane protein